MENHTTHGYAFGPMNEADISELEISFGAEACKDFVIEITSDRSWYDAYFDPQNHISEVLDAFITNGYDSLSDEQKAMFKKEMKEHLLKCGWCESFNWSDAMFIIENGLCSYCYQKREME